MWATSLGVYAQVNGTTVGPFGTSGGGDVTASGTPTAGQVAEWVSASSIQGVTGTGTGAPVMQTSPTLVTPDLGTPSTLNLANATALPFSTGLTGTILASQMLALPTGDVYQGNGSNQPAAVAMSAAIDAAFGSAQGSLLTRNATVWTPLTPGTAGYFLQTQGPSANLDWASASGGSGCTISGGAQYQIVVNNGSSGCSSSANASVEVGALTLGQSGTPGSIVMGNATSGTLTLEPATGALGSDVAVLPANSGTISELNLAQTYTAAQIFANSDLLLRGSSTGATTFASANSTATNYTITVPAVTDTMLTSTGNGSALTGLTWSQIGTTPNTLAGYGITNGLSTSLANTNILVGNGSGNAAAVAVSGDATLANTGALTVTKSNGSSFGTAAFDDTGTSGATVPLNNGNNNSTGNNIHSGAETFNGTVLVAMRKVTASGDITVSGTADYFICVDKGTGAATAVNLPASPGTGLTYLIKDCKGDAATNNITITPAAGDIDGSGTYVISNNYGSVAVTYNGTAWSIN